MTKLSEVLKPGNNDFVLKNVCASDGQSARKIKKIDKTLYYIKTATMLVPTSGKGINSASDDKTPKMNLEYNF